MPPSKTVNLSRLKKHYLEKVIPELQTELGVKNKYAVPRLEKAVINVGMGQIVSNPKLKDAVINTLTRISGQKPVLTRARKSISSFKIRKGMIIGAMVTLRGPRMYDFLDKLIHVSLPRIRDFRGINPKSVDAQGNLSLGIKEHTVFPEIRSDEVEALHGLEIQISTSAANQKAGLALLKALGFPIKSQSEADVEETVRPVKKRDKKK